MFNDALIPDIPSTELDPLVQLIRRVARHARANIDELQPDEIFTLPEVQALLAFIAKLVESEFDTPVLFLTQSVCTEYANKETWTLREATILAAGLDPIYYNALPKLYPQHSKDCLNTICYQCIMLEAPYNDNNMVVSREFCRWALDVNAVHEFALSFFRVLAIKSLRPERIRDVDPLCGSTQVNNQG
jgi:hypothetical protein